MIFCLLGDPEEDQDDDDITVDCYYIFVLKKTIITLSLQKSQ